MSDATESHESLNADAFVADQLRQYLAENSATQETPTESQEESHCASDRCAETQSFTPLQLHSAESSPARHELRAVAVEVPPLPDDEDEYELLPGHSIVQKILDKKHTAAGVLYQVHLESGEKEWRSRSHIVSLENGPEALRTFNQNGHKRGLKRTRQTYDFLDSTDSDSAGGDESDNVIRKTPARRSLLRPSSSYNDDSVASDVEFRASTTTDDGSDVSIYSSDLDIRPRRSKRIRRMEAQLYAERLEDNDASSDGMGTSYVISSRTPGQKSVVRRSSRLLRGQNRASDRYLYTARTLRASARDKKLLRQNLREKFESEDDAKPKEPRYQGVIEHFEAVPFSDPFRKRHRNVCESCAGIGDDQTKGPLVFCQGCTSAFHRICLRPRPAREHLVTKVDHNKFVLQCCRCLGVKRRKDPTAPHLGCCTQCGSKGALSKPLHERLSARQEQKQREQNGGVDPITEVDDSLIDNVDNILFRCVRCVRAYHFYHLPPRSDEDATVLSQSELSEIRADEYCQRWMCPTCLAAHEEVETLIAWRPVNSDYLRSELTADALNETEKEYLVKWKHKSYFRATWMPGSWVYAVSPATRRSFLRSPKRLKPHMTAKDAIPEEYLRVDIVFDVRYSSPVTNRTKEADIARVKEVKEAYVKYKGLDYDDAVWETVPSLDEPERWTDFKRAYEDWVLRDYVRVPKSSSLESRLSAARAQSFTTTLVKGSQPSSVTGGKIMEYQLDGMNWLYYMWYRERNAILADEMGLGKTIQTICFLATLIEDHGCWPFLIVAPNSTCLNWRREIKHWVPSLRVVTYYGSATARQIAHDYEMFPNGSSDLRCHILITSYEAVLDDKSRRVLASVPWAGLVVDEGQRLKNDKTQIYEVLFRISFPFKVLLTGTPLQNDIRELFNLIQFIDPTRRASELQEKFGALTKENVLKLHDLIRPFFLRRTKAQVLSFLPPMARIVVPVSMTVLQKKLYKSILARNSKLIKAIFLKKRDRSSKLPDRYSLNNVLMQLRKCLSHPFVYSPLIEEQMSDPVASHRNLVDAAGKFQLLELMLPKLKVKGHRVLLFSQFLETLDLLEDFLDGLGLLYCRFDGRMNSHEKQKMIDAFNAPDSDYFAFLLSTRSGGVGINLSTADTVIILDPDFNPHQDIQALSRVHRIGQKQKVLVFQFMTSQSAEEKIVQIGKEKMALDYVLIEKMRADDVEAVDLKSILRHGAEALFSGRTSDIHYDSKSVDKLLDRSQAEDTDAGRDASAESEFSFAKVWKNDVGALEDRLDDSESSQPPSTNLWEKILQERERAAATESELQSEAFGRGKRKRNAVNYALHQGIGSSSNVEFSSPTKREEPGKVESDPEFIVHDDDPDQDEDLDEYSDIVDEYDVAESTIEDNKAPSVEKAEVRPSRRVSLDLATELSGNVSSDEHRRQSLCAACSQRHPVGYCPLKQAGVDHCGLCGIAHFGTQRACPHLRSEAQIQAMLRSLEESTEPPWLVEQARSYLRKSLTELTSDRAD